MFVAVVYLFWKWTCCPPHPASLLPSAHGEVDSNGLNSEEKAESTIGRKIKIIKTNSNCSQRNQFHNFSASLSLLLRLCSAEQRACTAGRRRRSVCTRALAHVCVHGLYAHAWCMFMSIYTHTHACFVHVGGTHKSVSPWGTGSWPHFWPWVEGAREWGQLGGLRLSLLHQDLPLAYFRGLLASPTPLYTYVKSRLRE